MPDPEFLLLGDALWLEFVNTVATPSGVADAIPDAGAYLRWTQGSTGGITSGCCRLSGGNPLPSPTP